ncbi:MAG: hemolysin family protein [Candidatus Tectimicrobiota bacterium]
MEGTTAIVWGLLLVALLVVINAFFVAAEYALVRVRRTRLEALAAQGSSMAKVVLQSLHHLTRYIAGVQVGITLAGLASGRFGEPALAALIDPIFVWLAPPTLVGAGTSAAITTWLTLIVISYLLVVLGELVPKAITLQYPEQVALLVAKPMRLAVIVFTPFVWSMNTLGSWILRLLRLPPPEEGQGVYSVEELQLLIIQSHQAGVLEDLERQVMQRGARVGDLCVGDVMIPRLDIAALNLSLPPDVLLDRAAQTIHTRLPAYEDDLDHVVGILHLQDLFKHLRHPSAATDVRALVRPPLFVPKTMALDELLRTYQQRQTQIALVVDEHGSIEGLVTLEDVVEEVFGEMHDTLEAAQPSIQLLPDGRVLVRGEVRLRELQDRFGWDFAEDDVDTIAGYIMKRLGRTARVGDTVDTPYGTIRVENMARMRITQVAILPLPTLAPEAPPV